MFQTYILGTFCKGYILLLWFPNLLPGDYQLGIEAVYKVKKLLTGDCKSGVQSVYKVSEPTSKELSAFLYGFRTYLQGTVGREYRQILLVLKLHPGDCMPWAHSVLQFQNLPPGDCWPGVEAVYKVNNLLSGVCKSGVLSVYKAFDPTSRKLSTWVQQF